MNTHHEEVNVSYYLARNRSRNGEEFHYDQARILFKCADIALETPTNDSVARAKHYEQLAAIHLGLADRIIELEKLYNSL